MAFLLADDYDADVDYLSVTLHAGFEFLDVHSNAVGYLLLHDAEYLLADNLRAHKTLGAVGGDVVREEVLSLDCEALQHRHYLIGVYAVLDGYRDYLLEVVKLGVLLDYLEYLALVLQQVDLVEKQHHSSPVGSEAAYQILLDGGYLLCYVRHEDGAVHVVNALPYGLHHVLGKLGLGLVHTRRIHENVLRIALGEHAVYAVSRSLRLLADYGYLLADQQVGERGFSGVCAPRYCNECVLSHYLSSL